jgi:dolichol kinase
LLHVATGFLGVAALVVPPVVVSAILGSLTLAAVVLELERRRHPALQAVLARTAGGMLRPEEERGVTGATVLLVGYTATWALFPVAVAAAALAVTAVADPAAALAGRLAAPPGGGKTWTGSGAAFVAAVATLAVFGAWLLPAVAAAAAAALAERVPGRGADNVVMPLATAAVLRVLA